MDVRHVKARVTTPAEPHLLEDIGYRWNYYDIPGSADKAQLMVGLGEQLKANELRLMLDLTEEDVQENLSAISQLSLDAASAAASPMLHPVPQLCEAARRLHTPPCCTHEGDVAMKSTKSMKVVDVGSAAQ